MSEEEIIKHIKTLNEITKKNNKKGIVVGLEISTDMADKLLNLIEKQEKEIIKKCEKIDSLERDIGEYILEKEKQDKMIDYMAEKLAKKYLSHPLRCTLKEKEKENIDCCKFKSCTECIKQYFRKRVEENGEN